jgi:hypothetical protein
MSRYLSHTQNDIVFACYHVRSYHISSCHTRITSCPPHTDIDTLDEAGLRTRVAQIAAEFVGRSKWENLRLSQSLKQVEAEVSSKYLMLMLKQRSGEVLYFIFHLILPVVCFYCCGFFSASFSIVFFGMFL